MLDWGSNGSDAASRGSGSAAAVQQVEGRGGGQLTPVLGWGGLARLFHRIPAGAQWVFWGI